LSRTPTLFRISLAILSVTDLALSWESANARAVLVALTALITGIKISVRMIAEIAITVSISTSVNADRDWRRGFL